jgi:hypothetical protein
MARRGRLREWLLGGLRVREAEAEDEERAVVDEIGALMGECELERPGAKVEELGRLLKKVRL